MSGSTCAAISDPLSELFDHGSVGGRLRYGRAVAGLFRGEVVESLGWPLSHLATLEQGGRLPTLPELVALSRLYQLDLEFFRPTEPPTPASPGSPRAATQAEVPAAA